MFLWKEEKLPRVQKFSKSVKSDKDTIILKIEGRVQCDLSYKTSSSVNTSSASKEGKKDKRISKKRLVSNRDMKRKKNKRIMTQEKKYSIPLVRSKNLH